ncbi:MAG: tetratricopeptide repeat protein, partial [Thermoguttaceae bacterium]|nr:tetratricopeptide repeat protein [Thermoguttaceae bacterium]
MRYLPFLFLLFNAVVFAADAQSDKQSTQYSQERQFNVAQKTQIDGFYDNALKLWNEFLEKYPQSTMLLEAKYNRGLCLYQLEKFEDAKRDLDEVLKSGDANIKKAEALLFCGLSAQRLAEKNPTLAQEAQKRLEELIKEFPNSDYVVPAKFNLAKVYEQMDKTDDAKKLYISIWQKSPQSEFAPDAYLQTGYILFTQKSYSQCARLAMEFSKRWNQQPEIYTAAVLAGDALYSSGDYEQAEKQYAFACDPTAKGIDKFDQMDYAMYHRGLCLYLLQNYEKAAEQFSEVITRFPKSSFVPEATLACGDANWKNKKTQKAKEYLLKAAEFDECSPKANLILAE